MAFVALDNRNVHLSSQLNDEQFNPICLRPSCSIIIQRPTDHDSLNVLGADEVSQWRPCFRPRINHQGWPSKGQTGDGIANRQADFFIANING